MSSFKLSNDSGIYMITCTANGKIYIGSAAKLRRRWYEHQWTLQRNTHDNPRLQNSWNKYGASAFKITILEKCNTDVLLEREQFYLDTWQPEFNIGKVAAASRRGVALSPEHKAKIGAANKGSVKGSGEWTPERRIKHSLTMKGVSHSQNEETRAKISATLKGRKKSPETCAKMSASQMGKPRSPETRAKIGAASKGRKLSPETRAKISLSMKRKAKPDDSAK